MLSIKLLQQRPPAAASFMLTILMMSSCLVHLTAADDQLVQPLAPALYVFGDSLLDSGNNNLLLTAAKANYPPYGNNFAGGPTGRFTNGRTVADFIAEFLGLPYPPPFIAVRTILWSFKWHTGFNYASGACGILKDTGSSSGRCLSLSKQVKLFNTTINHKLKTSFPNHTQLSNHLSKSIFVIAIANNDYLNGYFSSNSNLSQVYTPHQFAQLLINGFSHNLKKLYTLGARKIVVFEVAPLGCILRVRNSNNGRKCDEEQNHVVSIYNGKLRQMLSSLSSSLTGSRFVVGSAYGLALDAMVNPIKYGFENSNKPCCKPWSNDTALCVLGLPPCKNPDKYVFWDGVHSTEALYSKIAVGCINGSGICTPQNVQLLLQL